MIEFTANLKKEFKHTPLWKRHIVGVKLLKFVIAHYQKTFIELITIDPSLNTYFMRAGRTFHKVSVLLDITKDINNYKIIKVKLDSKLLTWSEKKLLK